MLNQIVKKCMDVLIAIMTIIVFLPCFLMIPIAIKLDSKGPVFFKQKRLTKHGKAFTMYKFRTMIENAEQLGTGLFNYENDFRVTKVGGFLRRTSLDELPQMLNVLKGDMSIVGPRPPVTYELGDYDALNETYKRRFTVLPGLTGLAQVSGRNELPWDEKVIFDNEYINLFNKYGVFIDLKILLLTIFRVFKMKQIYEVREETASTFTDEEMAAEEHQSVIANASSVHYINHGKTKIERKLLE